MVTFKGYGLPILGNPGVTHSVPTAFTLDNPGVSVMNAVGTECVTPGLPRMWFAMKDQTDNGSNNKQLKLHTL